MNLNSFRFFTLLILLFIGSHFLLSAQCKSNIEEFNSYFSSNILRLDPIEGVWKVSRTTKLFSGEYLRHIQKYSESETWIITKNGNQFITCYPELTNQDFLFEWTKDDNVRYYISKFYKQTKTKTISVATLKSNKIIFNIKENDDFLKISLGEKYQNGISIIHEYELTKMEDYFDKVTNQIPVVKNWLMEGVKSYLNKIF